jgi:hypothetical protein
MADRAITALTRSSATRPASRSSVDREGRIIDLAEVSLDYTRRPDPEELLAVLDKARKFAA